MDVYTLNGNHVRHYPNADGTTRIELELDGVDLLWKRLFALATYYLALHERLRVDYVIANHMGTHAVVRQADFTPDVQRGLVATMLHVVERSNALIGIAERTLFQQPTGPVVETNTRDELRPYAQMQLPYPRFLAALVAEIGVGPAAA